MRPVSTGVRSLQWRETNLNPPPITPQPQPTSSLYRILARRSPVALIPNAVLFFKKTAGTFTYNAATGNDEPDVETIRIDAFLRRDKSTSLTGDISMLAEELHLLGYLLPTDAELATLDISQECRLELNEPATGGKVTGDFTFQVRVSPYGQKIREVAGVPVIGTLIMAGSGELN